MKGRGDGIDYTIGDGEDGEDREGTWRENSSLFLLVRTPIRAYLDPGKVIAAQI